ncbi:MAG: bifunctional acetaldehyde-CoA/alcohol dehydrogenase [Collinsella sp.]
MVKKSPENTTPAIVDNVEALEAKLAQMREAQALFATYTQEQVDKIFYEAAMAANKARIPLAKMAIEETGRGVLEDKVIKNHYAAEYIYNAYKNTKTCGVLERDEAYGITKIAEPIGIVGAVIPTTNPTSTAIFKTLISLKTRNAIIISPHPAAAKCTIAAAKLVLDAAVKAGAPEGIIGWVDVPSIELTNMVMRDVDIILATGGPGMVKAAYSSGKPALGVGAGNTPVVIDDTADVLLAVNSIIHSKTFDNGMICASEQSVTVIDTIYDQVKEFQKRGATSSRVPRWRCARHVQERRSRPRIPGRRRKIAGCRHRGPAKTKILIAEVNPPTPPRSFPREALPGPGHTTPRTSRRPRQGRAPGARRWPGHTASLYVHPAQGEDHVQARMKACRIVINTPSSHGGIGDLYNFGMKPSLTLGCGSWGGNSVSENVGVKHLINVKTVAERRENMLWFRAPEKVYFKKGSTPVALDELGNVMGKKRAFIVTDQFLFKNGNTRAIEAKLDEMGIAHDCFYDVEPDPSLQCARRGAKQMALFEPDVIIAVGGGSAMDAGKIMWMMYEHPECKFEDMAMDFMDIRKRIFTFPEMGKKAYFVAVPTSSGTGSECTPFAIITDKETGIKWPLADYALLPNMAIVDADNCMTAPRGLTAASGIDVMTHAIESYVSIMASDYTKGLSERAAKLVFENLPSSFTNGAKDPHAREEMHNASCMAGMAFANAFLGLNHSMAHKLGAFHHLPHGIANAVILTRVMRYNAAEAPVKMGTFSQYPYPNALHNYAEMAKYCGIEGKDDKEVFENFITKLEELKDFIGVKKTIADYGVDEQYFLDTLDEMTEQAFNDQCTGANPRYPLMSEIKELYLDAYYGREPQDYAVC